MLTDEQARQYEAENAALPNQVECQDAKFMVMILGWQESMRFYYASREDAQKRYDFILKYDGKNEDKINGHVMLCELISQTPLHNDPVSTHMCYS